MADDETNYSWTRERLGLQHYDFDQDRMITREPTPAEILELMDALHADQQGTKTPAYEAALNERYWNR